MDGEKNHFYHIVIGHIGILLILIINLRYILIADDAVGPSLITLGLVFILDSLRFMNSKFLTVKERRIVDWSFFSVMAIIFIIGFTIAKKLS